MPEDIINKILSEMAENIMNRIVLQDELAIILTVEISHET